MTIASLSDFREAARKRLPHFLFEYLDGGSFAEQTLHRNVADLAAIELRQRVMRDVAHLDTATALFGRDLAMPVALAPVGIAGLYARRGECQAARAAERAGIPFTLSTVSLCALDEVAGAASKPFWFQLYMLRDRGFMRDLLAKASATGCDALILTADLPVPGSRYRDQRSGLSGSQSWRNSLRRAGQAAARPRWAWDVGLLGRPHRLGNVAPVLARKSGLEDFLAWIGANFDPAVTWQDLDFVRENWRGRLIVKGILDVDDAKDAVRAGADGIVVSNHGGRQLDGVPSTARALPAIAETVGSQLPVLVDGGVRSGLDILRMLALGARGVLIGRPWVYALACGGEAGVARMLAILEAELRVAMALAGVTTIAAIGPDNLVRDKRIQD